MLWRVGRTNGGQRLGPLELVVNGGGVLLVPVLARLASTVLHAPLVVPGCRLTVDPLLGNGGFTDIRKH